MKLLPRFTPEFLQSVQPNSPEELFVDAVETIAIAYSRSNILAEYGHAHFEDMLDMKNQTLYFTGKQIVYTLPSEDVESTKWKKRLLSYGKIGEVVVNAIGDLKIATDLLLGKQIDFRMPYKREVCLESGYINGSYIDYGPSPMEASPALLVQIGDERINGQGVHFPILSLCTISMH